MTKGMPLKNAKFDLEGGRGTFQKPNFFSTFNFGRFREEGVGQKMNSQIFGSILLRRFLHKGVVFLNFPNNGFCNIL